MNATEVFKACLEGLEKKDYKLVESMAADDFTFSGSTVGPVGLHEFIELQRALEYAIPDWRFNLSDTMESGDSVSGMVRITGTHTGYLMLGMLGLPKVPPSGRLVRLPREPLAITVRDGKISRLDSTPVPGGGVEGILQQIGVKIPHHA